MKLAMSEKIRILLIENQKFQFDIISNYLVKHKNNDNYSYVVSPEQGVNFVEFIDFVRVWINEQYNEDYRKIAIARIKSYIEHNKIDIIIMDYNLGGAHHCKSGIELAGEINREKNKENCIPMLFLSKTEYNEENKMHKYDEYKTKFPEGICTQWIHKGYFGDEILKKEYFENKVIPEIYTLLEKTQKEKLIAALIHKRPILSAINNYPGSPERKLFNLLDDFIKKLEQNEVEITPEFEIGVLTLQGNDLFNYLSNT